jgi:hypothetical protein
MVTRVMDLGAVGVLVAVVVVDPPGGAMVVDGTGAAGPEGGPANPTREASAELDGLQRE